jgi:hypothetical protein
MALEKSNPIPKGVYWLDVVGTPAKKAWHSWMLANRETVHVFKKEVHPWDRWWLLFEVKEPTPRWPEDAKLGLPTISKGEITSEATEKRKAPEASQDYWARQVEEWFENTISPLGKDARSVLAFAALAYFFFNKKD